MSSTINVHLADGDPFLQLGLQSMLSSIPEINLESMTDSKHKAFKAAEQKHPDILLVEPTICASSYGEMSCRISSVSPETKLVFFSSNHDLETMLRAYFSGAQSFLSKSSMSTEIGASLRLIHAGHRIFSKPSDADRFPLYDVEDYELKALLLKRLSRVDKEILGALCQGYSNAQIGELLHLAEGTVKQRLSKIMEPLRITNRVQLAVSAQKAGLNLNERRMLPLQTKAIAGVEPWECS